MTANSDRFVYRMFLAFEVINRNFRNVHACGMRG
jgi:hypothetical protein